MNNQVNIYPLRQHSLCYRFTKIVCSFRYAPNPINPHPHLYVTIVPTTATSPVGEENSRLNDNAPRTCGFSRNSECKRFGRAEPIIQSERPKGAENKHFNSVLSLSFLVLFPFSLPRNKRERKKYMKNISI